MCTCLGSFAISATIRTIKLPMATVNNQPACSTAFMLLGAYRFKSWKMYALFTRLILTPCNSFADLYLWVGKFQTSNREHDFSSSYEEVLWDLKGHVYGVGLDVLCCSNGLAALKQHSNNDSKSIQSTVISTKQKLYCVSWSRFTDKYSITYNLHLLQM